MSRALPILLLVALLLVAGGGLLLYMSYGLDAGPPSQAHVPGLEAPARLDWHADGLVAIEAQDERDAYAALGFVHGHRHAWDVVLWRQTATGRLAEWFGDDLLPVDRLVQRLGLGTIARSTYAGLPDDTRALLDAYTAGLNAALADEETAFRNEFVLHDVTPTRWEPWHTLAVERLFAWLATTPPRPDTLDFAGPDAVAFFEADRALRQWLRLHGFENSLAWAVSDTAGVHFLQRHVYGATARPVFQEVRLSWEGGPSILGATIPGTPFFPSGRTETQAWALLLYSPTQLVRTVDDTAAVRPTFERIVSADGTEHLLMLRRQQSTLYFDPPPRPEPGPVPVDTLAADTLAADTLALAPPAPTGPPPPDSTWSLQWAGFEEGSDWAAWRALVAGEPSAFRLVSGSGLQVDAGGAVRVLGQPRLARPLPGGMLVGNTDRAAYAALRLDTLLRRPETRPAQHIDDRYSTWAAQMAPPMIDAAVSIPDQPALVTEALTYLRNWDYNYDRASIAASIFDTWIAAYRDSTGQMPAPVVPDTLVFENIRRFQLLVDVVDDLAQRFGTDLSRWRWERVQPRRYLFPVWSSDDVVVEGRLPRTRYAPLELPGDGHPTTLHWGPSSIQANLLAPAQWEAWIETANWDAFEVRRYRFEIDSFFGRHMVMDRPPDPAHLDASLPARRTTTLLPAGSPASDSP